MLREERMKRAKEGGLNRNQKKEKERVSQNKVE